MHVHSMYLAELSTCRWVLVCIYFSYKKVLQIELASYSSYYISTDMIVVKSLTGIILQIISIQFQKFNLH